ncbi:nucleoid-associated protein [Nocardioides sp. CFH 31398]|uniref:nucleoid-associated protein n=1 Tax=Nocardioides sp. CFH 31398 TaxID=2919579 RepID=UPI001F0702CD|nr:nucleoid-associated protein [Nocardioides sp. CFH 31398]MCH1867092.1 nucleoid-associated protein [Nocardioides sp. CFH 31398]
MVHDIPRGRGRAASQSSSAVLSENPTVLDAETDRFIREQMLLPTLDTARQVVATQPEKDTTTPRLAHMVLDDISKLPEVSRELAQHLFDTQSGSASSGIFIASKATLNGKPVLVLIKAEHQEGVRLQQSGTAQHVAFRVEHISELIVGANSKVYKIAVLWFDEFSKQVEGLMVDKQNGVAYAGYFLHEFLEMSLRHRAEVTTKEFLEAVNKFVQGSNFSAEKKLRYTGALAATLESPNPQVDPTNFIRTFIDKDDRDALAQSLPQQAKAPFTKDTKLVQSRIGGVQLRFGRDGQNLVQIRASQEALDQDMLEVGPDQVTVKAPPDSVEPSGPPR